MSSRAHVARTAPQAARLREDFRERFGGEPQGLVRGPGRVNLIGEHTDYNDGFVLPLAIDAAVWIALRPRADRTVRVWSADFGDAAEFSLDALSHDTHRWTEYIKGVAWALAQDGYSLRGWEGVIAGEVPIGAGLSSSAALEIACARAFADVSGLSWDSVRMAQVAQTAENGWIGLRCGIMDQLVAACGREGHAILIDCRSLDISTVPMPADARVVVLDTGTRRNLSSSAYNTRRQECETAAQAFGVAALRDLTVDDLGRPPAGIHADVLKRARHVVTENARVLRAAAALERGDHRCVGALMTESHHSLRDDFEASTPELDTMVECAERAGSVGARMTGGGFGGCAVALVHESDCPRFVQDTLRAYQQKTHCEPTTYVCRASAGVSSEWRPEGSAS
jgi:galactokinase